MTELEIRERLANLKEELNATISTGEAEQRELTEEETNKLGELRSQIAEAEAELANIEAQNRKIAEQAEKQEIKNNETKTHKRMKLVSLINAVVNNSVNDEQRAYIEGNKITMRAAGDAVQATEAGYGQENVPEDKKSLDVAIRNASILNKMGATWFGNAVGDISMPKYSGSNVGWKGEIAAADNGIGTFSEVVLSPKRLTAYVDVSKQFLLQDSNDAEAILIADLADAIAEKFDKTIFGTAASSSTQPAGLLYSAATYVDSAATALSAVTYDDVLKYESAVEEKNGTNFMFIVNPKVKYALKGTQMASRLAMVYQNGEIDGYKALSSNSVAANGLVCMDPRDLAVATWNGVEITVDTVSRAIYGEVRLVVNYFVDAKLRGDRIAAEIFE